MVKGMGSTCMCQNCTNTEYFAALGRVVATALGVFRESYQAMREQDDSLSALPASLARLTKILSSGRKYQLCLEVTCGEQGKSAKLSDRLSTCMKAECRDCPSLKTAWADVKAWLLDEDAKDEGRSAHAVFTIQRKWRHYAYRKKGLSTKQKLWEASRANDDPAYKPKTEQKELYVKGGWY
jgi:hypothetical protein